jgi:hypothetical protein
LKYFRPSAFLLILCLGASAAQADDQSIALVKEFVGACVQAMPQIDRVEAAANALGWKRLEGDIAKMLQSRENPEANKLWLALRPGMPPYMIGTSRGTFRGKPSAICVVSNPYAPSSAVANDLTSLLHLFSAVHDEVEAGQRMRVWSTRLDGREGYITLTDASPLNEPGVTLAVMLPER